MVLLLLFLHFVKMVPSVSFEGTCLLVPQYTISAKQELCWNRESRIKVWKLQDSGIKEEFTSMNESAYH